MNKRGLSPVVATTLLIVLALILALIIFLWARSFLTEKNVKFGEAIENSCKDIVFDAEASTSTISIVNKASIPLYEFEIYSSDSASRTLLDTKSCNGGRGLSQGETCQIDASSMSIHSGDTLLIVPVLLGEKGANTEPYSCTDSGKEITVGG